MYVYYNALKIELCFIQCKQNSQFVKLKFPTLHLVRFVYSYYN